MRIPPFNDAHMHFMLEGKPLTPHSLPAVKDAYVKCGILSVSDMGHRSGIGLQAKALFHSTTDAGIKIKSAGYAIYKRGTYGSFLGKGVSGASEIRKAVNEIADAGADFIKVINSGIVSAKGPGLVTEGGFLPEELNVLNRAARSRNLCMVCHANSDTAVQNALAAGAVSIEHGYFISHDTLHKMEEERVEWIPTLFALLTIAGLFPAAERAHIEKIVEGHLSSVSYAASIGVRLRIGTDSGSKGVAHGRAFFDEMQLFSKAGLSLQQIISAACMDAGEMANGNFIEVDNDFIASKTLRSVFVAGVNLSSQRSGETG